MKHFFQKHKLIIAAIISLIIVSGFIGMSSVYADEGSIPDDYKQTIYNQENGLDSTEVICLYQTKTGYIWVGTESGLYRYNGSDFELFDLWDTDSEDVYYINSLFQDSQGRLWVATENYGLFYISGNTPVHFTNDYYNGVKCINDVCEDANGNIYVATAYGLYTVNESDVSLTRIEPLAKHNIKGIVTVKDKIWGIYNGNYIFTIDNAGKVDTINSSEYSNVEISSISATDNGVVYIGTISREVLKMKSLKKCTVISTNMDGINDIYTYNNRVYVCSDTGVGYIAKNNYYNINDLDFDKYITSMIVDYEGNFWFSSSRSGILYMERGKFTKYKPEGLFKEISVNTTVKTDSYMMIGTDEGLFMYDNDGKIIENDLTKYMSGVAVKDIIIDSDENLWISTYKRYGIVKYTKKGDISSFGRTTGILTNLINCAYQLNDGNIAICTEEGVNIIDSEGEVLKTYDYNAGLEYPNILDIYQDSKDMIYIASDGGGLYTIDSSDNITNYSDIDGLASNVVTRLVPGEEGIWIGTDNGMSYYADTFRTIRNIDSSNNIYDMIIKGGRMYIIGSRGLMLTTEEELLSAERINAEYYDSSDGLDDSITINSRNYLDENGELFLCCNKGINIFDTRNIYMNEIAPKLTISDVDVDGKEYHFDQTTGNITIPSDAQRIEITFAVLSYVNRENIQVKYRLEGFDTNDQYLTGKDKMQLVYTNLDGGEYQLNVSAINGDGVSCDDNISFTINKELGLFERKSTILILSILVGLIILLFVYEIVKLFKQFNISKKELDDLAKEHEDTLKSSTAKTDYLANMSNEIKLPVNAIISSAGNILKDGIGDENQQSELRTIIEKGNDVIEKVDETIKLARLESGAETKVSEPYSITTLICDISDKMLNVLDGQPIKFLVDIGENIPDILVGDFDKIKAVLTIILDNACKYTKEGSITLAIDCYDVQKKNSNEYNLVFTVSDTGIGLSEERLEHLFEIYYVEESKKSTGVVGNGVSLAIAKKMVDIMDGDIEVESTEGAGTTFTISLYQEKPDNETVIAAINENSVERVSREEAEKMWCPDVHALLVDDDELSRNVSMSVIEEMEIKCDTAASGINAVDMIINNNYDIVFMDVAMPVMNGIDALNEIRDLDGDEYKEIPVVAMTEDATGKNRNEVIEEGFNEVIVKPFDITVLAGILLKTMPHEKVKYKTNDVSQYMAESRYSAGLKKLEDFFDVVGTLEKIGGSIDVYNRILLTFYTQNVDSVQELKDKFNTDYRGFRNRLHNIRNGCQNMGAIDAAEIALRIENAINLGNKSYVRDNLDMMLDCLTVILKYIEEYIRFVDDQKGITDTEMADKVNRIKNAREEAENNSGEIENTEAASSEAVEEGPVTINIETLLDIKEGVYDNDWDVVQSKLDEIKTVTYTGEDSEFLNVLEENISKKDNEQIIELITTYIDLKR